MAGDVWKQTIAIADKYYQQASSRQPMDDLDPDNRNMHRNVFFKDSKVPSSGLTSIDSTHPEDLHGPG